MLSYHLDKSQKAVTNLAEIKSKSPKWSQLRSQARPQTPLNQVYEKGADRLNPFKKQDSTDEPSENVIKQSKN